MKELVNGIDINWCWTKIDNLETGLNDFNKISTLFENARYGKNDKLYKLNTKKNILESVLFCLSFNSSFDINLILP